MYRTGTQTKSLTSNKVGFHFQLAIHPYQKPNHIYGTVLYYYQKSVGD